jgi:regulatory protein
VIDSALVAELRLARGTILAGPDAERLLEQGEEGAARERALRYLKDRDRSRAEVERRLARYGYGSSTITRVADYLAGYGFIDDRRFAESYVRSRARSGWGSRRLTHELLKKGVDKRIAERAVAALRAEEGSAEDQVVLLVEGCGRRFGRDLADDPVRARRRIQSYLQRRGHDWDMINQVLVRLTASDGEMEPEEPGEP